MAYVNMHIRPMHYYYCFLLRCFSDLYSCRDDGEYDVIIAKSELDFDVFMPFRELQVIFWKNVEFILVLKLSKA